MANVVIPPGYSLKSGCSLEDNFAIAAGSCLTGNGLGGVPNPGAGPDAAPVVIKPPGTQSLPGVNVPDPAAAAPGVQIAAGPGCDAACIAALGQNPGAGSDVFTNPLTGSISCGTDGAVAAANGICWPAGDKHVAPPAPVGTADDPVVTTAAIGQIPATSMLLSQLKAMNCATLPDDQVDGCKAEVTVDNAAQHAPCQLAPAGDVLDGCQHGEGPPEGATIAKDNVCPPSYNCIVINTVNWVLGKK